MGSSEVIRACTDKAQKALAAFAEAYPESMRAAATRMVLKRIDAVE